jgi:hypothetical protein
MTNTQLQELVGQAIAYGWVMAMRAKMEKDELDPRFPILRNSIIMTISYSEGCSRDAADALVEGAENLMVDTLEGMARL